MGVTISPDNIKEIADQLESGIEQLDSYNQLNDNKDDNDE